MYKIRNTGVDCGELGFPELWKDERRLVPRYL